MEKHKRIAITIITLCFFAVVYNIARASIQSSFDWSFFFNVSILFLFSVLSSLCVFWERAKILHPLILIFSSTISLSQDPTHYHGYVFFGLAIVFLFSYGYMQRHFFLLTGAAIFVLVFGVAIIAIARKLPLREIAQHIVFSIITIVTISQLLRDEINEYKKPIFDFKKYDFDEKDILIIKSFVKDTTSKTIAANISIDCSPSFVDNRLSVIYRRIGVNNRAELSSFLANYRILSFD